VKLRESKWIWNLWPPFVGLGISIEEVSSDFRYVRVRLKKRPWNVNYFGTQFGGGIFSMTDGVHMLMLVKSLPRDFRIWDKSASIDYLKRGQTDLIAEFKLTEEQLQEIQSKMAHENKIDWSATVEIKNLDGTVVARVVRVLSIKKKIE
jgi:acyl-coenzyme A thioesterase PaaI-like protein